MGARPPDLLVGSEKPSLHNNTHSWSRAAIGLTVLFFWLGLAEKTLAIIYNISTRSVGFGMEVEKKLESREKVRKKIEAVAWVQAPDHTQISLGGGPREGSGPKSMKME